MTSAFTEIQQRAEESWRAFRESRLPRIVVGSATCGQAAGSSEVVQALRWGLKERRKRARITEVGCLGLCYAEPLVEIGLPGGPSVLYHGVTPALAGRLIDEHIVRKRPNKRRAVAVMDGAALEGIPRFEDVPMLRGQVRVVMRNCGRTDPTNIDHYIARGGYQGLVKALEMAPEEVVEEVKKSGLRGRGGVGFPAGLKWELTRKQAGASKYIVANAEEGEPGTFKDRVLLEGDPHALLEGILIAGYAVEAERGFIFVQAEYSLAARLLRTAISQARKAGLCGDGIAGSDFSFDISVRSGVGSYVCGEESAALECVEGLRGIPRIRPPYPAQSGLFDEPTVVNNVETLACVPFVLREGADRFQHWGTEKSPGTKVFSLCGNLARPGAVEVPLGTPLENILVEMAGGPQDGKGPPAVLIGGPTGGYVPKKHFDYPVDFDSLNEIGAMMGSGGIVALHDSQCVIDSVRHMVSFIEEESCGKCVPCRLGARQMAAILRRVAECGATPDDLAMLREICETLRLSALCGLGQAAPNPVLSSLRHFQDEYDSHVLRRRCSKSSGRRRS